MRLWSIGDQKTRIMRRKTEKRREKRVINNQKNEKEMVNLFLAEWVQFCLTQSNHLHSSEA